MTKNPTCRRLGTLLLLFLSPGLYGSTFMGPRPAEVRPTPAVAAGWANQVNGYFTSSNPDPMALSGLLSSLKAADLFTKNDPTSLTILQPVTIAVRQQAAKLEESAQATLEGYSKNDEAAAAAPSKEKLLAEAQKVRMMNMYLRNFLETEDYWRIVHLQEKYDQAMPRVDNDKLTELMDRMVMALGRTPEESGPTAGHTAVVAADATGKKMPAAWTLQPSKEEAGPREEGARQNPRASDDEVPGPEELSFQSRMLSLLERYVSRERVGLPNLTGYLSAGDYATLAYFLDNDFYAKGFLKGRASWTRWFYSLYRRSFMKDPDAHLTRFLRRWASAEATDYLAAIGELKQRTNSGVSRKAVEWRESIDERAAALIEQIGPEALDELARRAATLAGTRGADFPLPEEDQGKAVLVELYRYYQWMNERVAAGRFTPYYAQVIKGNTYRFTFDNGLTEFAQWGIFDHDPLPELR